MPPAGDQANAYVGGVISAIGPTAPFAFRGQFNISIWAAYNTTLTVTGGSLSATTALSGTMGPGNAINSVLVPRGATWGTFATAAGTIKLPPQVYYGTLTANVAQIGGLTTTAGLVGASVTSPFFGAGVTVSSVLVAAVPATDFSPGVPGIVVTSAAPASMPGQSGQVPISFGVTANGILASGSDTAATFTGLAVVFTATIFVERSFDGGATWLLCNQSNVGTVLSFSAGTPVSITLSEAERNVLYRLNCSILTPISLTSINYRISQTGSAAESLVVG